MQIESDDSEYSLCLLRNIGYNDLSDSTLLFSSLVNLPYLNKLEFSNFTQYIINLGFGKLEKLKRLLYDVVRSLKNMNLADLGNYSFKLIILDYDKFNSELIHKNITI